MEFHQKKKWQRKGVSRFRQIVDGETEVENELDITNCLNRSFQKLGFNNGQYVSAPNNSSIEVRENFCFRTVTLKELYDAIDSLDNNKFPGPGVFRSLGNQGSKFSNRKSFAVCF